MTTFQLHRDASIKVVLVEPWELGDQRLDASVVSLVRNAEGVCVGAAVRLAKAVTSQGQSCEFFWALPRKASSSLDDLLAGPVDCNLTCISREESLSPAPEIARGWRGGVGLVGTVLLEAR